MSIHLSGNDQAKLYSQSHLKYLTQQNTTESTPECKPDYKTDTIVVKTSEIHAKT